MWIRLGLRNVKWTIGTFSSIKKNLDEASRGGIQLSISNFDALCLVVIMTLFLQRLQQ